MKRAADPLPNHRLTMNETAEPPIMIGQRLAGIGTILVGLFALYHCWAFVQMLWDTPSKNLGIGATVGSVLMILVGVFIGFPDWLPKKLAASNMVLFGLCSVLLGASILLWFLYNALVAKQPEFVAGPPAMAGIMIVVGAGMVSRGYRKLTDRKASGQ